MHLQDHHEQKPWLCPLRLRTQQETLHKSQLPLVHPPAKNSRGQLQRTFQWRVNSFGQLSVEYCDTNLFLDFVLLLLAQGPLCHCHFSYAERLQLALKQRLWESVEVTTLTIDFHQYLIELKCGSRSQPFKIKTIDNTLAVDCKPHICWSVSCVDSKQRLRLAGKRTPLLYRLCLRRFFF